MTNKFNEKKHLYRLFSKQDPESFAVLYDIYVKRIYRFVYFKVGSHEDAEDIVSDVFLKAWNVVSEKKEIKSFSGLLYRIARNAIIDLYRLRSTKNEISQDITGLEEPGDKGEWFEEMQISLESKNVIADLKKLKQTYQEVITLKYIDGLNIEEIAEITEKSRVSVRVTLHRAIKKMKDISEKK